MLSRNLALSLGILLLADSAGALSFTDVSIAKYEVTAYVQEIPKTYVIDEYHDTASFGALGNYSETRSASEADILDLYGSTGGASIDFAATFDGTSMSFGATMNADSAIALPPDPDLYIYFTRAQYEVDLTFRVDEAATLQLQSNHVAESGASDPCPCSSGGGWHELRVNGGSYLYDDAFRLYQLVPGVDYSFYVRSDANAAVEPGGEWAMGSQTTNVTLTLLPAAAVPEPTTGALAAVAAVVLAGLARGRVRRR